MSNVERLAEHPEFDPDTIVHARALLREVVEEVGVKFQQISPRSNEVIAGNNVAIPAAFAFSILPYDRKRVTAQISNPAGSGATVYIGSKSTVNSGGGFPLYPGKELTVASVAEVVAMATAQCTLGIWLEREGGDD